MNERDESFDEMLDEAYEPFTIGSLTFSPSSILFNCDPIAYRIGLSEYQDFLSEGEKE
jgi:hypothetical protein